MEVEDSGNWTCALDYYDGYGTYGNDWKEKNLKVKVYQVRNGKANTSTITSKALTSHITKYSPNIS